MTELDKESLARAAFGKRIAAEDLETEGAYVVVDAILQDIERQGFQITRMVKITGRVNTEDKPQ